MQLSSSDLERLGKAQRALLSPLNHSSLDGWQAEVGRAVKMVLQADHAVCWYPTRDGLAIYSDDVDGGTIKAFQERFRGFEPGRIRSEAELIDRTGHRRAAGGPGAYHESALYDREEFDRSAFCQEFMRPAGLNYCLGLSVPLVDGEAAVMLAFERPDADGFGEEGLLRLNLLVPAFEAGAILHARLERDLTALERVVDHLDIGVFLRFPGGRTLANRGLTNMLAEDPDASRVRGRVEALALRLISPDDESMARKTGNARARTPAAEYRLSGGHLALDDSGRDGSLVVIDRRWTALPSPERIRTRFGLTPRQAQVALLMAEGTASREIARSLRVSPHTVRRHEEAVLRKLGLRSRAGIALSLLREA